MKYTFRFVDINSSFRIKVIGNIVGFQHRITDLFDHIQEIITNFTSSPLFLLSSEDLSNNTFAGGAIKIRRKMEQERISTQY